MHLTQTPRLPPFNLRESDPKTQTRSARKGRKRPLERIHGFTTRYAHEISHYDDLTYQGMRFEEPPTVKRSFSQMPPSYLLAQAGSTTTNMCSSCE